VEEQFYLLWPLILLFLLRALKSNRYGLLFATSIMIGLSTFWMAALYSPDVDPLRIYYGTDTRAAGFLVGGLLAMLWSPSSPNSRSGLHEASGWVGLLALLLLYNKLNEFQPFLYRGGILSTALASAVLIVGASTPGTVISRLLETRLLRWIGSRSYSIYLWHWPVLMLTRPGFDVPLPAFWIRIGQVAVTFLLAEISYRWIETPFRQNGFVSSLRSLQITFRRWSLPQRLSVGAGIASASLLLIWQGALHPVNAGRPVSETPISQSTLSSDSLRGSPAPPIRSTPSPTAAPILQPSSSRTATPEADLPRVTFIGDSIMQGAAPMFDDVLGADIYIDAARKRKMEDVPALVRTLFREGHLARVVVIHLGSNRPFEDPVFDAVMEALLDHGVERAIFINVHRPIGWEYYINQKFVAGVKRWPQAELIDWKGLSQHEQGWFIRDQTHLSYAGSQAYVAAIQEKLEEDK